jgi:hypothetical protein
MFGKSSLGLVSSLMSVSSCSMGISYYGKENLVMPTTKHNVNMSITDTAQYT